VDQGVALLAVVSDERRIRLDEVAAGLLDARFDVGGDEHGLYLRGERDLFEGARPLLGRSTPCVGREHELGLLDAVLNECERAPSARAVLVTAAGVGKAGCGGSSSGMCDAIARCGCLDKAQATRCAQGRRSGCSRR
jgi:hypothetical protein